MRRSLGSLTDDKQSYQAFAGADPKRRLSRLTITEAKKLFGAYGEKLIIAGGAYEIDLDEQVVFKEDYLSLKLPDELRLLAPDSLADDVARLVKPLMGHPITDMASLLRQIQKIEAAGAAVHIYPDAEEHIEQSLFRERVRARIAEIRRNLKEHPLRTSLLKTELLPYQLDGIAFAVGAGRAVLADDMGLGKTIQGIGAAELFARETGIRKVLIVCPASLKSQWNLEIQRFSARSSQLVMGSAKDRHARYADESFFTICNYEQVLRDILAIETVPWDLIILDEAQRIKNWEAKTSRIIKGLRSKFALVLSGTPLENRLEELFSVVEFE